MDVPRERRVADLWPLYGAAETAAPRHAPPRLDYVLLVALDARAKIVGGAPVMSVTVPASAVIAADVACRRL